ncbi:MAG: DUF2066 domain-containing protein [Pseudomonadaceae bacterium]
MPLLRNACIGLVSLCLPLLAQAAVVESLYQVDVPPQAEAEQSAQLQRATQVMLERLAGAGVKTDAGPLAEVVAEPTRVTRQVGSLTEDGALRVDFDPLLLREALGKAKVPVLGRNRPGILVWAVQGDDYSRDFLAASSEMGAALKTAGRYRGVALMQPLADLEDRGSVSEQDVVDASKAVLEEASQRYANEGVLALAIQRDGDSWGAQWTLWLNDRTLTGKAENADPAVVADELMRAVAAEVHAQYAVGGAASSAPLSGWQLEISGINSIDAFANLQRTLQQLGMEQQPSLLSVEGDRVHFRVDFAGDRAQLERMLMLDQRLVEVEPPALSVDETAGPDGAAEASADAAEAAEQRNTLYYRWR